MWVPVHQALVESTALEVHMAMANVVRLQASTMIDIKGLVRNG